MHGSHDGVRRLRLLIAVEPRRCAARATRCRARNAMPSACACAWRGLFRTAGPRAARLSAALHRAGLMTAMMLCFVFCGVIAGYVSSRLHKTFKGGEQRMVTLKTALMFPGVVFTLFFVLNMFIWGQKSSGAVPFGTFIVLMLLWFGAPAPSTPPVSAFLEPACRPRRRRDLGAPRLCGRTPRRPSGAAGIPDEDEPHPAEHPAAGVVHAARFRCPGRRRAALRRRLHRAVLHPLVGLAPPILLRLWVPSDSLPHPARHVRRGAACDIGRPRPPTPARTQTLPHPRLQITIVLCYFQLCAEDYRWWWRSFLTAGSSGLYLFAYSGAPCHKIHPPPSSRAPRPARGGHREHSKRRQLCI